jgi:electron transfer flavoprotein alpha subunit
MTILVIADHNNESIGQATLVTIAAAKEIGGDIDILVAGGNCAAAGEAAAKIGGVTKVLVADNAAYEHQLAENIADLVVEIGKNYSHIMSPTTSAGKNYLPRIAALLDVAQISDISGVISEDTFERPIYAGNAIATVQSSDSIKVISVRGTAFDAVLAEGGSATVESLDIVKDAGLSSWVKADIVKLDRPELTAASIIISGGRGMQNGENFKILESVA